MATYRSQWKESFTSGEELAGPIRHGVSILTDQKVVIWYDVFDCFGKHSLFDTATVFILSLYIQLDT